jgi:glyceraldehyde-3-phosphate dehydrogenase (NAD(P))
MIRVGVNGYGTIGRRVADAIRAQPDMRVEGVTKRSVDAGGHAAVRRGFHLYAPTADRVEAFDAAGLDPAGTVEALVGASDVVFQRAEQLRVGTGSGVAASRLL